MKTILFLDRCYTPYLSKGLYDNLSDKVKCIFFAYSQAEVDVYKQLGINDYIVYQDIYESMIDRETIDDRLLHMIDKIIIEESDGRFNLNSSLQSNRSSQILTYKESLLSAQVHFKIWQKVFDDHHVDLLIHEPCSHFFNHIAALLCKRQGGKYLSFIHSKPEKTKFAFFIIEGDNYKATELEDRYSYYYAHPESIQIDRCKTFVEHFRNDFSVFAAQQIQQESPLWKLKFNLLKANFRKHPGVKIEKVHNPIDYWLSQRNIAKERYENYRNYKKNGISFITELPENEKYYYYSIHLEPEAVVLYWGDGIYNNQIKLIENIAASLPPDCYLYVKDHPHAFAYRKADDYGRLLKVPNIRLLHRSIPGKQIIKNAIGVFSINGTAGFEALMLGKQSYCFGRNYYSFLPRVNFINNIRELRDSIYNNVGITYKDDIEFYAFVNAYLDASHPGFANFACANPLTFVEDSVSNAKDISDRLLELL